MPRLALVLVLMLTGCSFAYDLHLPTLYESPRHVVKGTLLQRALYVDDDCSFAFGETIMANEGSCLARLTTDGGTVFTVPSLEFFGAASARLFTNGRYELWAFEVTPAEPWQFEGMVDYYASEIGANPLYGEWIYSDVEDGASYVPCDFVDQYGYTHEVANATRSATWEDDQTRLDLTEDACEGPVTLRFTDRRARP